MSGVRLGFRCYATVMLGGPCRLVPYASVGRDTDTFVTEARLYIVGWLWLQIRVAARRTDKLINP